MRNIQTKSLEKIKKIIPNYNQQDATFLDLCIYVFLQVSTSVVKWSEVVVGWSVVKWSEGFSKRASNIIRKIYRSYEVCCLYGCFVYHILSYSFGSIFIIVYVYCMFCRLLFNFVNYIFLIICLCIPIVMFSYSYCYYVPFWVFCFIVLFYVLFVCKCVLFYCYRVSTQFQLTNISYHINIHGLFCPLI